MKEGWHGTAGGYTNHSCRCDECREAWRKYHTKGGYDKRLRDKHRGKRCLVSGCTRKRDLAYPGRRVCKRHRLAGHNHHE